MPDRSCPLCFQLVSPQSGAWPNAGFREAADPSVFDFAREPLSAHEDLKLPFQVLALDAESAPTAILPR